jgi:hypothetical protein
MNMPYQYGDLPQIPSFQDEQQQQYSGWPSHRMAYQQYHTGLDEIYESGHMATGMMRMQAVQRFLGEPSPITPGLLQARVPHYNQHAETYEQWPAPEHHRYNSPGGTSVSGNSSYATQNEIRSPLPYHSVSYGSPKDYSQAAYSYPSPEHLREPSYTRDLSLPGGNVSISLRDIEYDHQPEPEPVDNDAEPVLLKTEVVYEQEPAKMEATPIVYKEYHDANVAHSVRDGESVQPMEVSEGESSDTEYTPKSSRRRRSSASTSSSSRQGQRRRSHHARKSSSTTSPSTHRVGKRGGRSTASYTSKAVETYTNIDSHRHFPCPLATYGCQSTFSSKNEWKRHVSTQHIKLGFWRCDLCVTTIDPHDEHTLYHNDFNRKDLFTQHLRRMHAAPPNSSASRAPSKTYPVNEDNITEHQTRCFLVLRTTPPRSQCLFCPETFEGPSSWEGRMEHIGRHLERDRKEGGRLWDIEGWRVDKELEKWLLDEDIIDMDNGQWRIGNGRPIKYTQESDEVDAKGN